MKSNPLLIGLALGFSIKGFNTELKSNLWFSYPDIRTMILHSAIYSIFQNTVTKAEKSNPLLIGLALGFSIKGFKTQDMKTID